MSISSDTSERKWFKWYYLYYFLAAFDVLTISASLYLNHTVLGIYSASVDQNSVWSNRVGQYSRLNELAAVVNAPGNDAFDSGDIVGERRQLAEAYQAFQKATTAARSDLEQNGKSEYSHELLLQIGKIDAQVALIQKEAIAVFVELENNRQQTAGSRMAEMDRCFSRSLILIGALCEDVRQIQSTRFDAETARAHRLGNFEFTLAGVICLILCVVVWYGHKMHTVADQYAELETRHADVALDARTKSESLRSTRVSLEESEKRLELAVRGTSDGLWDWDIATDEVWYAPRFLELLGYSEGEFEFNFHEWERRLHPDDREFTLAAVKQHLEFDEVYDVQYRLKTKSGEWRWYRARGACVRDASGGPIRMAGALQDITDHKIQTDQLAEQDCRLQQKQKLEAVGSLAGGIAHEFNNLLQAIQGFSRFAQQGLDETEQRYQDLGHVLTASDRAATLTSQLLCFSRAGEYEVQAVEVEMLLDDLANLLKPVIDERIVVAISTKPGTDAVLADPAGLHQVLLNLCVNARDAMPDGGLLNVKAETVTLSPRYCEIHGLNRPGDFVCFSVTDSGTGMTPEQIERIYEPFFTTKEVGKGTGLGLAMVHGFVERHDGIIDVYSEPGEGTTFHIYLPVAADDDVVAVCDEQEPASGGNETLLIAEDEPMVLAVAERILTGAGYHVLSAANGREAVETFSEHRDQIALTLLDVVMPIMTGRQAFDAIRQIAPAAPVMFCTGYDPETSQAASFQQDQLMLVQKPYNPDGLLRAVRQLLDQPAPMEALECTS